MKTVSIATLLLSLVLPFQPLVAQTTAAHTAIPSVEISRALPEIERRFADFLNDAHVPGLVYGIVVDGRLVHVRAMGVQDLEQRRPVDADSLFRIASMTKAFTALSILKLRDSGKLDLEAPAET
jgi:CubicO group peptidase (beta-lactamase class C family)